MPSHSQALKVSAICQSDIVSVELHQPLSRAISLMAERHIGSVLVTHGREVCGLLTRRKTMEESLKEPAAEVVTRAMLDRVLQVDASLSVDELGLELISQDISHAIVMDINGHHLGIVSQSDVVNHHGLEHDLFLRSLEEVTNFNVLRFRGSCCLRDAIERMRSMQYTAVLVGSEDEGWQIMTETDVIRHLSGRTPLHTPLYKLGLPELMAVDGAVSLFNARRYFKENGFRHIGVRDSHGSIVGLASYSDILRSVELDYIYRLRELLDDKSRALRQSEHNLQLIERVINASHEGIVITDANGRIQSVNPAFTAITGYEAWEALGQNPSMLSSGRHDKVFYQHLWAALAENGNWQGEIWNRRKDGSVYPEWLSITAIENDAGDVCQYAAIFHDLTESKKSEARVKRLSWFDSVTGLANRRLFNDRLQIALNYSAEHASCGALLALDLDLFKQFNDRFGHQAGDQLLRMVAERIESTLEEQGTAARPSGDEFYILLTEVRQYEDVNQYLNRLSKALTQPFWLEEQEVKVRTSIGIALYPDDANQPDGLILAAESALHFAKEMGRNSIAFYQPRHLDDRQSRYRIASVLHQAIEQEEFSLVYQPQVSLKDGQLVGAEALLRWDSSTLGKVTPDRFIPVAEDTGMIDEIGAWVLDEAVSELARWNRMGHTLKMSVNVSARQFQRSEVADQVLAALEHHAVAPEQLVVELTETSFMHSASATERELVRLREKGVRVAIDDFGTGYSSLSYIREMSLDLLKIDRSFIQPIPHSETDRNLVKAMIDMSHAMGLAVVAEGIEQSEDLEILKELGCDQAQGYYIARPMSGELMREWIERDGC
ncbi:EAL domain-containing protein [Marinobacterium sp. AK62]|uniref:EAL domain-containing protein n=1 Tax=Marinobacterium alkalitolerans TaxID=1542925 RepID=A0ABS3ZDX7_9GAMM|nr:EAL domain-containing protein [Marinobacterium alkalitolerans]MBP0049498.1 EAL domain-containing protein [Marinobacterium alkalitolerans]